MRFKDVITLSDHSGELVDKRDFGYTKIVGCCVNV